MGPGDLDIRRANGGYIILDNTNCMREERVFLLLEDALVYLAGRLTAGHHGEGPRMGESLRQWLRREVETDATPPIRVPSGGPSGGGSCQTPDERDKDSTS